MKTESEAQRKWAKRVRLFKLQKGLCYWCHKPMLLVKGAKDQRREPKSPLMATFEHLDSRYSQERGQHSGQRRIVLSHDVCNQVYNRAIESQVELDELRRRSAGGQRT